MTSSMRFFEDNIKSLERTVTVSMDDDRFAQYLLPLIWKHSAFKRTNDEKSVADKWKDLTNELYTLDELRVYKRLASHYLYKLFLQYKGTIKEKYGKLIDSSKDVTEEQVHNLNHLSVIRMCRILASPNNAQSDDKSHTAKDAPTATPRAGTPSMSTSTGRKKRIVRFDLDTYFDASSEDDDIKMKNKKTTRSGQARGKTTSCRKRSNAKPVLVSGAVSQGEEATTTAATSARTTAAPLPSHSLVASATTPATQITSEATADANDKVNYDELHTTNGSKSNNGHQSSWLSNMAHMLQQPGNVPASYPSLPFMPPYYDPDGSMVFTSYGRQNTPSQEASILQMNIMNKSMDLRLLEAKNAGKAMDLQLHHMELQKIHANMELCKLRHANNGH
jgi:hypothetical protein